MTYLANDMTKLGFVKRRTDRERFQDLRERADAYSCWQFYNNASIRGNTIGNKVDGGAHGEPEHTSSG